MKAFKTFIKSFEAPQRGVKIKIYVNFFLFVRDWDGKGYNQYYNKVKDHRLHFLRT